MVKSLANTQEKFWKGVFGIKYKSRNESTILKTSNKFFFKKCLKKTQKNKIKSMIEFGPNIGLNIIALQKILKLKKIRGVEINKIAYENLAKLKDVEAINKSVSSYKSKNKYDLVLSKGFLIHINPNQLNQTYKNIYNSCSANGYILIAEYYSPKPVAIDYRGNKNVLFKRDFATEMLKIFKKKINLIDYGFAYHGDKHPQDDLTWFLFKKMVKLIYCKVCLYPNTKPHLTLNKEGICNACTSVVSKKDINWKKREQEFYDIIKKFKKNSNTNHDCVIPVSGGKDSTYQVVKALEFGLNPLCVTATTDSLTDIGRKNIENIKNLGVDYIEVTLNPVVRKKINKFCLETIGDISWPEHVSIFTLPIRIAAQHNIKLIIWGENSQTEYGGPDEDAKKSILDHNWLQEFGGMGALRVDDLISIEGIDEKDLILYRYPDIDLLNKLEIHAIFLGYYFNWDSYENKIVAEKNGFIPWHKKVEGNYYDFENLDNYQTGIHDYFCFLKYGYGRASAQLSTEIRKNRITRDKALEFVKEYGENFPHQYLGKDIEKTLEEINLSLEEFIKICDKFTNKKIFKTNSDGILIKDDNLSLQKINHDN